MLRYGIVLLASAACLSAAPRLRLGTTTLGPLSIATGTNGTQQIVPVYNIGDGTFNFTLTSPASWLTATYTAAATCTSNGCGQIAVNLGTSALARGQYTGILTILDPNALDVPQIVTVTINIGGTVPDAIALYAPPGGTASTTFTTGMNAKGSVTGAPWLSVAVTGQGSFAFAKPWLVKADATNLTANTYNGNITFIGSDFPLDNKEIPVTFNVTGSPIVAAGDTTLTFNATSNAASPISTPYVWLDNVGQGTLTVADTTVTVDTGSWLTVPAPVALPSGVLIGIAIDATGLAAGPHLGTITIDSNAANSPTVYSVELDVAAPGTGPEVAWPRILNISSFDLFSPQEKIAPGEIVAVYGTDMLDQDPINITATPPLPTQVGSENTQVLVNGTAAPIFYASNTQINIQIPFELNVGPDAQIQVVRNGIKSAIGTVPTANQAPQILRFGCGFPNVCPAPWGNYGIGLLFSDLPTLEFPMAPKYPIPNIRAATTGDVIEFFATGLGQMTPPLVTGAVPSTSPLPTLSPAFTVCFATAPVASGICNPVQYAGIAPGFVGLYQVNVGIPANAPRGDSIYMTITNGLVTSDFVMIAIQ